MEMFRIADDWAADKTPATSSLISPAQSDSPKGVRFEVSEPATVYYTTDGSTPTLDSPRYKQTEFREPGETLWVEQTTTFKWFSVDAAGNLEAMRSATVPIGETGGVGGVVPATLALTLSGPATFGAFTPGLAKDYTTTTTANVISSAGDAGLTVSDPGHLANGTFTLPSPLEVALSKTAWSAPVSNDPVTVTFNQHIGASDALRTGAYSKTLTFTLSTTTP
jgi:hypothetical protein